MPSGRNAPVGDTCRYNVCRVTPNSRHSSPTCGFRLPHRRHGQAQLRGGHLVGPPARPAACPRRRQAGDRALGDECALELGQGGKNPEHQLAGRGGGVDRGALAGEHLQAHAAGGKVVHGVDQVAQVAAQTIELPQDQEVALAQCLQARRQPGAVVAAPRRLVLVEPLRRHPGGEQRVALQVGGLGAVRLRHPHVADEHVRPLSLKRSIV